MCFKNSLGESRRKIRGSSTTSLLSLCSIWIINKKMVKISKDFSNTLNSRSITKINRSGLIRSRVRFCSKLKILAKVILVNSPFLSGNSGRSTVQVGRAQRNPRR